MEDEIKEYYNKVKDKVTEEEFEEKMEYFRNLNENPGFMDDSSYAAQAVSFFTPDEEKRIDDFEEKTENYNVTKIEDIKETPKGDYSISISGTVMSIGDPKVFTTKNGKKGKLANVVIADDTGTIRTTFWTESIKLLKNFEEGDIIQINNVAIQQNNFSGNLEATLSRDSTVIHLNDEDVSNYPSYSEEITKIADIDANMEKVNIIARIIRIPSIRVFEREDKPGKVASIELKDNTGEITYTLWNASVDLINSLSLEDGDAVKILGAVPREDREGKIGLTHRDGRIIKGDYDVPEAVNEITKIIEVKEQENVNIMGVITKIQDIKTFTRNDGSDGKLQSFEVQDATGAIRVTVWGDDTNLDFKKGKFIKIIGGSARFDEYTASGYSLNTNWNTQITLDPNNIPEEDIMAFEEIKERLVPIKIENLLDFEDEGVEVDVMGRIISTSDLNEFQRDDGTVGLVRSVEFSDGTGLVTLSLWGDRADYEFKTGDAYLIENARTKLGMYAVDLNVGATSRILPLDEEQASILPAYESIEEMIYENRYIDEIDEDDQNIRVIARIIEVNEPREFNKQDGTVGLIRRVEIADNTGAINLVLWNDDANNELEVGEAIKIDNPRITYNDNDNRLELQSGRSTSLLTPNDKDVKRLPSFEELKELIYQEKTIDTIEADDTNIRIKGIITNPSNNRVLLNKCPNCGASLPEFDEDDYCEECGQEYDEPNHVLMVPARLRDLDSEEDISITFFGKLAEELLNISTEDAAELIGDADDLGVLEGRIDDLEDLNIEIIADVDFNEYTEERRLKPKKILSKGY